MRRWWLKRFTLQEIRELAAGIWTDAETADGQASAPGPPAEARGGKTP